MQSQQEFLNTTIIKKRFRAIVEMIVKLLLVLLFDRSLRLHVRNVPSSHYCLFRLSNQKNPLRPSYINSVGFSIISNEFIHTTFSIRNAGYMGLLFNLVNGKCWKLDKANIDREVNESA